MRVVVTGGAGFIGSHLVEELCEKGYDVIVIDNFHSGNIKNIENFDVRVIEADAGKILELKEKIDCIFHLGIYSSSPMYKKDRSLVYKALTDFIKIMEFVKETGCKLILTSSSSLYNGNETPWKEDMVIKPLDFYTEARYAMERIAKVYNLLYNTKTIILRLFSVYGTREEYKKGFANLVSQFIWYVLKDTPPIIYGDGSQSRDFIYVKDVVQAYIKAMELELDYDVFNVGFGKSYSLNELILLINKLTGKNIEAKYVENPIKNYVYHTLADTTKAKKILKFKAKVELKEGIKKILPYYESIIDQIELP